MINMHGILIVAVISLVTIGLRFLPFLIFNGKRSTPEFVTYLGRILPYAIMGMLVVYCLKGISITAAPYGLPEFIACVAVVLLHLWKRNTLISIVGGTVCYMFLAQVVF